METKKQGEVDGETLRIGVYGLGIVFTVEKINLNCTVEDLQKKIVDCTKDTIEQFNVHPSMLKLYLARKEGSWLMQDRNTKRFLQGSVDNSYEEMLKAWQLNKKEYFGNDFVAGVDQIHILVELPSSSASTFSAAYSNQRSNLVEPLMIAPSKLPQEVSTSRGKRKAQNQAFHDIQKKAKWVSKSIAVNGPVQEFEYSVPMDTIPAYERIKQGISVKTLYGHPLYLLYGPRQFGKTTIAYRLMDWISTDENVADVRSVFLDLNESDVETVKSFWTRLGQCIDVECSCENIVEFERLVVRSLQRHEQLFIIIDELDAIFRNKDLAHNFLLALRKLKSTPYYRGFLGIGSHDLVYLHIMLRGDDRTSPFNLDNSVKMEPFSTEQMSAFFKLIESRYAFSQSLQIGIMGYSSGAPGVFGSLLQYTIDNKKWTLNWNEWEAWFTLRQFPLYLAAYNKTYFRIKNDLQNLPNSEWEALKYILENEGKLTSSQVEIYCSSHTREIDDRAVNRLMRMGVVCQGIDGVLFIVSEVMRRVCVESLPAREINEVASAENPVLLLTAALRQVIPKNLSSHLAKNRLSPSESVFHHELYSTIRDILKQGNILKNICAEAKTQGSRRRADIIVENGTRLAFELKVNQLRKTDIEAAIIQAEEYRNLFHIDHMLLVNFVPDGHVIDQVYSSEQYPKVQIIHAQFNASCDTFCLQYLENEILQTCSVMSAKHNRLL